MAPPHRGKSLISMIGTIDTTDGILLFGMTEFIFTVLRS
jgi:hypothetical protein